MCCALVRGLFLTMAAFAFVEDTRCQDDRAEGAGDDDSCFPIWWPRVQTVPFEVVVANRLVRTCCGGCAERVRGNPAEAIKKLEKNDSEVRDASDSKTT